MKILAIFAHPDDESFGPAGTLAKLRHQGHHIALLTFTHGEAGSLSRDKYISAEKLAKQRNLELHKAANKIGIEHITLLDFPDKNLQNIPAEKGEAVISRAIEKLNADCVITFHSNTISGHPDHLAVTNWTLDAVKALPCSPILFLYGLDQQQTAMVTFRKLIPIISNEITHRINVENFINTKIAAIQCHKTQNASWLQFEGMKSNMKTFFKWEVFVQKWPKAANRSIRYNIFK